MIASFFWYIIISLYSSVCCLASETWKKPDEVGSWKFTEMTFMFSLNSEHLSPHPPASLADAGFSVLSCLSTPLCCAGFHVWTFMLFCTQWLSSPLNPSYPFNNIMSDCIICSTDIVMWQICCVVVNVRTKREPFCSDAGWQVPSHPENAQMLWVRWLKAKHSVLTEKSQLSTHCCMFVNVFGRFCIHQLCVHIHIGPIH